MRERERECVCVCVCVPFARYREPLGVIELFVSDKDLCHVTFTMSILPYTHQNSPI